MDKSTAFIFSTGLCLMAGLGGYAITQPKATEVSPMVEVTRFGLACPDPVFTVKANNAINKGQFANTKLVLAEIEESLALDIMAKCADLDVGDILMVVKEDRGTGTTCVTTPETYQAKGTKANCAYAISTRLKRV